MPAYNPPTGGLTLDEANNLAASLDSSLGEYAASSVVFDLPIHCAFILPDSLASDFSAADQAKKQRMIEISFEVLQAGADDFNTAYLEIYNAEYP